MSISVSIVLSSYSHERYAQDALVSILKQDTRFEFEVVIIDANPSFRVSAESSDLASDLGVPVRKIAAPRISVGEGLAMGIRACKGSIVAFLDDDDLWEPTKLEAVGRAFDIPRVCFFHNGQTFVDERDMPILPLSPHRLIRHPSSLKFAGRTLLLDSANPSSIATARPFEPDFNNSSIAVRRSVLDDHSASLSRVTRGEDTYLYHCALASKGLLAITTNRLTRYRIHHASVTSASDPHDTRRSRLVGYLEFVRGERRSLRLVRENLLPLGILQIESLLNSEEAYWATMQSMIEHDATRAQIRLRTRYLLGDAYARPRIREIMSAGIGVLSMFAPRKVEALFSIWRGIW